MPRKSSKLKIKLVAGSSQKVDLKKIEAEYMEKFGKASFIRKSIFDSVKHEVDRSPEYPANLMKYSKENSEDITEYDLDPTDVEYLEAENQRRSVDGLVDIPEEILQKVVERIEKDTYKYPDFPPDTGCNVCGKREAKESDDILYCDLCNVGVHQGCYGVEFVSEGMWLCRKCILSPEELVKCELCPLRDGAFKPTLENKWAHVSCATWLDETSFMNTRRMDVIKGAEKALQMRAQLRCVVCKTKGGACIQCSDKRCANSFHVTCAMNAGLTMGVKVQKWKSDVDFVVNRTAFCHLHGAKTAMREFPTKKRKAVEAIRSSLKKQQFDSIVARVPSINDELRRKLEAIIGDFFGDEKNLQDILQRVCDFWVYKRVKNGGGPLITRDYEEARIDDEKEEEDKAVEEKKNEKEGIKREKADKKEWKKKKEQEENKDEVMKENESKEKEKKMVVKEEREVAKAKRDTNSDQLAVQKMPTRSTVKVEKKMVVVKREIGKTKRVENSDEKKITRASVKIEEKDDRKMVKREKDPMKAEVENKKEKETKKRGRKRKNTFDGEHQIAWDRARFTHERVRELADFMKSQGRAKMKAIESERGMAVDFLISMEEEIMQFLELDDLKIFELAHLSQYSQIENKIDLTVMKEQVKKGVYSSELSRLEQDLDKTYGNYKLCYAQNPDMLKLGRERQRIMRKAFDDFLDYLSMKDKFRDEWIKKMHQESVAVKALEKSKEAPTEARETRRKRKAEEKENPIPRKGCIKID